METPLSAMVWCVVSGWGEKVGQVLKFLNYLWWKDSYKGELKLKIATMAKPISTGKQEPNCNRKGNGSQGPRDGEVLHPNYWVLEDIKRHLKPTIPIPRKNIRTITAAHACRYMQKLSRKVKASKTWTPSQGSVRSFSTPVTLNSETGVRKETPWKRQSERSEKDWQVKWKQKCKQRWGKVLSPLFASSRHSEVMSEKWWIRDHRQGQEQQGSTVWPEAWMGK